jgi:hypothetical protein
MSRLALFRPAILLRSRTSGASARLEQVQIPNRVDPHLALGCGAARGIRTPDLRITKPFIATSRQSTLVHGSAPEYAQMRMRSRHP